MGFWNAKMGKVGEREFVGPYGIGERNDRGERLNAFAIEEQRTLYLSKSII